MRRTAHKRALTWAGLALMVCLVPLAARVWLHFNGAVESVTLGVVGEFVMRDEGGRPLTRDQLRRSVTIVVNWPSQCVGPEQCLLAKEQLPKIMTWVRESLEPKWTEEKNPLNLLVVGEGAASVSADGRWRRFPEIAQSGSILPASADVDRPTLVLVDNILQFAAMEPLDGELDFTRLSRVISKTAFDQYLGNYLARRTFMGPKRTQN